MLWNRLGDRIRNHFSSKKRRAHGFLDPGSTSRHGLLVAFSVADDPTVKHEQEVGMSSFLASCLTVNYVSVGYIFVPYGMCIISIYVIAVLVKTANHIPIVQCLGTAAAFATTGLALTSGVFLLVMLQAFITCTYVMESCARAELLASLQEDDSDSSGFVDDNSESYHGYPKSLEDCNTKHYFDAFTFNAFSEAILIPPKQTTDEVPAQHETEQACIKISCSQESHDQSTTKGDNDAPTSIFQEVQCTLLYSESIALSDAQAETGLSGGKFVDENQGEAESFPSTASSDKLYFQNMMSAADEKSVLPLIRKRKFEMPELSRIFLGETWRFIFTFTICCDLYGLTWSIATVFASSLESELSIRDDEDNYAIFIFIFAMVVIPMTYLPIVDQVSVQLCFFGGRMLMVLTMLITMAQAFQSSEAHFGDQLGPQYTAPVGGDFRNFHLTAQICIFSTAFQFSVPVIAQASVHKESVHRIYGGSVGFIAGTVLLHSLLLATYLGSNLMDQASNVNWAAYHGGTGHIDDVSRERVGVAWWAIALSKFVVIYPAVDGISTFVLCAASLGEIIKGAWYGNSIHDVENTWRFRLFLCLIASVPQIIGAAFVRDLSVIATFAGLFTVASYTICPCLLQISSSRMVQAANLETKTHYSNIFSSEITACVVAVFGSAMILYTLIGSILYTP